MAPRSHGNVANGLNYLFTSGVTCTHLLCSPAQPPIEGNGKKIHEGLRSVDLIFTIHIYLNRSLTNFFGDIPIKVLCNSLLFLFLFFNFFMNKIKFTNKISRESYTTWYQIKALEKYRKDNYVSKYYLLLEKYNQKWFVKNLQIDAWYLEW